MLFCLGSTTNLSDSCSVTKMLLLSSYAGVLNQVTDGQAMVDKLLCIITEILMSINTHAYMSTEKANLALQMFTEITEEFVQMEKGLYMISSCCRLIMRKRRIEIKLLKF